MPSDATVWKRRERALAAGVVLWAVAVSAFVVLRPEYASEVILSEPIQVAGAIMVTIGFAGGFCESVIIVADRWGKSGADSDLTTPPWEENDAE